MAATGWAAIFAVLAALLAFYLARSRELAGVYGLPLDDGWIHARFAQNLARGYGFSFNPGEPTSTTTGPLWTLLLAVGYRLTGEHLFTGIALNSVLPSPGGRCPGWSPCSTHCWPCSGYCCTSDSVAPRPLEACGQRSCLRWRA
jgi:hypothetical protein